MDCRGHPHLRAAGHRHFGHVDGAKHLAKRRPLTEESAVGRIVPQLFLAEANGPIHLLDKTIDCAARTGGVERFQRIRFFGADDGGDKEKRDEDCANLSAGCRCDVPEDPGCGTKNGDDSRHADVPNPMIHVPCERHDQWSLIPIPCKPQGDSASLYL